MDEIFPFEDVRGLDRNHIVGARTFLALTHFKLNRLTVIEGCMSTTAFDFRMMDE